jgi:transcriptional regulator with XRE-family HTH domain
MHSQTDAEALADRIKRGGYSSAELEVILGVSQATVSRLRNGRIALVRRHLLVLQRHEAKGDREGSLDDCLLDLRRRADVDPALRALLLSLGKIMHNA